ncbi:sigma-70 family RNA polymerase sigma factor [Babesia caballi]|uniref:Sigma-70 family RNA polymerase sigma factor n=1 Tax=Babesia caballi TaxID=5871 RepID=A0AAV4LQZ5_BABCB|nr:sigma-70 family RNA polymerase sigma factor [Babesia caballi]
MVMHCHGRLKPNIGYPPLVGVSRRHSVDSERAVELELREALEGLRGKAELDVVGPKGEGLVDFCDLRVDVAAIQLYSPDC